MQPKLDAHAHFFNPGYVAALPASCRRLQPDEVTLYSGLAQTHHIQQVLAIGYEGADWARENNQYLASLAATNLWVRPLAFTTPEQLTISRLEMWKQQGFIGVSLYLFSTDDLDRLSLVRDETWAWLVKNRWLLSINSSGDRWTRWHEVLERHPDLRLLLLQHQVIIFG